MVQEPVTIERLERLKKAEPAIYFHIEEMFQKGSYTKQEQSTIGKLIELGNYQLEAACGWFEYDLMRAPYEVHYLEGVIREWDQIPLSERPAISRETVKDRLLTLKKDVSRKEAVNEKARRSGCFWSIVPLLEFFDLPEEERVGKSCYPLLPNVMQKAYKLMQTPNQPRPSWIARWVGRVNRVSLFDPVTGGGVQIERHVPGDSDQK